MKKVIVQAEVNGIFYFVFSRGTKNKVVFKSWLN